MYVNKYPCVTVPTRSLNEQRLRLLVPHAKRTKTSNGLRAQMNTSEAEYERSMIRHALHLAFIAKHSKSCKKRERTTDYFGGIPFKASRYEYDSSASSIDDANAQLLRDWFKDVTSSKGLILRSSGESEVVDGPFDQFKLQALLCQRFNHTHYRWISLQHAQSINTTDKLGMWIGEMPENSHRHDMTDSVNQLALLALQAAESSTFDNQFKIIGDVVVVRID